MKLLMLQSRLELVAQLYVNMHLVRQEGYQWQGLGAPSENICLSKLDRYLALAFSSEPICFEYNFDTKKKATDEKWIISKRTPTKGQCALHRAMQDVRVDTSALTSPGPRCDTVVHSKSDFRATSADFH